MVALYDHNVLSLYIGCLLTPGENLRAISFQVGLGTGAFGHAAIALLLTGVLPSLASDLALGGTQEFDLWIWIAAARSSDYRLV